jgi:hypothetical protein
MESPLIPAIREAVSSGEFRKALELWQAYSEVLQERARSGKLEGAELAEVGRLLAWTKTVAQTACAQGAEELGRLRMSCHVAAAYRDPRWNGS